MKRIVIPTSGAERLYGVRDENLKLLQKTLGIKISARGNEVFLDGDDNAVAFVERLFSEFAELVADGYEVSNGDFRTAVRLLTKETEISIRDFFMKTVIRTSGRKRVFPKSLNQRRYIEQIQLKDMVFGIGPAGTGKTYLAMALAISALMEKAVSRIILARPAVEAGERLGFLPGDLLEKVNPYLRPLYDALYDLMETDRASKLLERGIIEVAPIAFMRGRTLNHSFVILDEAQNTTSEQMKMFLTRIGFDSKAVITGDVTQIDLPGGKKSGLKEAEQVLATTKGLSFVYLDESDVVRHPLVQRIVVAYDEYEKKQAQSDANGD